MEPNKFGFLVSKRIAVDTFEAGESEMKKYMPRFFAAAIAFSLGITVIYFSVWDTMKISISAQMNSFKQKIHSAENNSPYSVLEGTTLMIKPYEATFEVPESWISYKPISIEPPKNLYLSWNDLNELERFDFNHPLGFDREDAQVMRAALPFEDCAAHLGSMSWGNGNTNDLQVRVFVVDSNSQEITEIIKNQALNTAQSVFNKAKLSSEDYGSWFNQKMSVLEVGEHTLLFKDLNFYYRSFGEKTVVFAFVHQSGWDNSIKHILDSFNWKN